MSRSRKPRTRCATSRCGMRRWAAFMASAHAKFTGGVGLCYATSGPGAIHLLTGLYDAKADHVPVVAIVGQQARTALGADYQQEVDLQNPLQGRGRRLRPTGQRPGAGPDSSSTVAVRIASTKPRGHLRDPAQRPAAAGLQGPAADPRNDAYPASATPARRSCPTTPSSNKRPRF